MIESIYRKNYGAASLSQFCNKSIKLLKRLERLFKRIRRILQILESASYTGTAPNRFTLHLHFIESLIIEIEDALDLIKEAEVAVLQIHSVQSEKYETESASLSIPDLSEFPLHIQDTIETIPRDDRMKSEVARINFGYDPLPLTNISSKIFTPTNKDEDNT